MHLTCTNMPVEKLASALDEVGPTHALTVYCKQVALTGSITAPMLLFCRCVQLASRTSWLCVGTPPRARRNLRRLRAACHVHWTL